MFTRHISGRLAAHLDGQLAQAEARQVEFHLAQCARCREECEQVRLGMAIVLPTVQAPDAIWSSIEAALREDRTPAVPWWRWALAAAVGLVMAGGAYWQYVRPSGPRWEVVSLDGSPSLGAKTIGKSGRIAPGEWIETDARSRARIKVGEIGSVEIEPNSRVRVVTARPGDHRLALARGKIQAKISAPPKLFFVETASGTAVDLGCEYGLSMDEDGSGLLEVTKGWVSFEWRGLESLVPAGASCRIHPQAGPGMPYFDDAPESLKQAAESFGFEKSGYDSLNLILSEARVRDTLTLWHLLRRVEVEDRPRVYDRMAALTPVPAGISRDLALKLDPETLKRWKEELAWTW
jgi:hypothetical protein